MDNTEMIQMITETAALTRQNEIQIKEIKDDIIEIKKDNKAIGQIELDDIYPEGSI